MNYTLRNTDKPEYYRHNLHWYGCNLVKIANQFNTPVHVACAEASRDAYYFFQKPFEDEGLHIQTYFSVKTNPLPVYLQLLNEEGCGFETVTESDLYILQKLGISPDKIIHTGDPELLIRRRIPLSELKMITLSTPGQVEKLLKIQNSQFKQIPVGFTINPQLISGYWDLTLNTSKKSNPLGFDPGSELFSDIVQKISESPGLMLEGLHIHLGSGIHSVKPYLKAIRMLKDTILMLKKLGYTISTLNIGGGFGLPSAPTIKTRNMLMFLMGLRNYKSGNIVSAPPFYLNEIAKELALVIKILDKNGIKVRTIAAEPGRLLSGGCQLIILKVTEVLHNKNGRNYIFCNSGAMSLSPMLLTESHTILNLKKKSGSKHDYTVLGTLPSALDQVAYSVHLSEIAQGDRIAVLDTGAYFLAMSTRFTGPMPPVVWIENKKAILTRKGENHETLFSMNRIPL